MRRPRTTAWVQLLLVGVVVGAISAAVTAGARADVETSFTATSSATGVTTIVQNGTIPLVPGGAVPVGGPDAQTLFSSVGQSHAFAASPDPGTTVAEAPGLAGNPGGVSYPFFAITDAGQPPKDAGAPGNTVHAESHDTFAAAHATQGEPGGGSATSSSRSGSAPDGTVTATSSADVSALSVTGAVVVTGVHSEATATRSPAGALKRSSALTITTLSVGGQSFGFANGAFTFAGSNVPVPVDSVVSQLAAAGVTASFQAERDNPDGLVGPALSLTTTQQTPAGATTYTLILGQAAAAVSRQVFGSATPPSVGNASAAPASRAVAPTSAAPTPGPTGGSAPAVLGGLGPGPITGPATAPAVAPQLAAPAGPSTIGLVATRSARHTDSATIYLAIAAAGLLGLLGLQLLRILGVRITWD